MVCEHLVGVRLLVVQVVHVDLLQLFHGIPLLVHLGLLFSLRVILISIFWLVLLQKATLGLSRGKLSHHHPDKGVIIWSLFVFSTGLVFAASSIIFVASSAL